MLLEILMVVTVLELAAVVVLLEWLRRELRTQSSAAPPASPTVPYRGPASSPGLSLHCGHTHRTVLVDANGLTQCPACASRQ